jgi:hypothetical protein
MTDENIDLRRRGESGGSTSYTRTRSVLRHADNMCWPEWQGRRRYDAWPGNTKHPVRQRRIYVLDLDQSSQCIRRERCPAKGEPQKKVAYLKTNWYSNCALESTILEFLHRIHGESRVSVGKERRGSPIA